MLVTLTAFVHTDAPTDAVLAVGKGMRHIIRSHIKSFHHVTRAQSIEVSMVVAADLISFSELNHKDYYTLSLSKITVGLHTICYLWFCLNDIAIF